MGKYKLVYFNARGRAEAMRLLFAIAGVDYEDCRLPFEEFAKMKPNTPFGQLPVLEVDGKQYAQSLAICRYLGKKFGMAGCNDEEAMEIDSIVDALADLGQEIFKVLFEKDEAKKEELKKKMKEEIMPTKLGFLEKHVQGKDGYFVGSGMSWVDVLFFNLADNMRRQVKKTGAEPPLMNFPKLKALAMMMDSNPKVKAWLEKRPETEN